MARKTLMGTLIAMIVTGTLALSACGHVSPEKRADRFTGKLVKELDLDESQEVHLNSIKDELMEKSKKLHENHSGFRQTLADQIRGESIDTAVIDGMIGDHREQMGELLSLAAARFTEFHKTLTPEQKNKIADKLEDWSPEKHRRCRW